MRGGAFGMEYKNKSKPNSLSRLIENMHIRAQMFLSRKTEQSEESIKFPCPVCEGHGSLIKTISFSRQNSSTQFIRNNKGQPITAIDYCDCPACYGSGADEEQMLAYLNNPERVS
jgi:DnaJ-class molecular chaperone